MGSEPAELVAEREIRQLQLHEARGIDRMEEALVRSASAPDATIAGVATYAGTSTGLPDGTAPVFRPRDD